MGTGYVENVLKKYLTKMFRLPLYRLFLIICGLPVFIVYGLIYLIKYSSISGEKTGIRHEKQRIEDELKAKGVDKLLAIEVLEQLNKKYAFLNKNVPSEKIAAEQKKIVKQRFDEEINAQLFKENPAADLSHGFLTHFLDMFSNPIFFMFSLLLGFPMHILVLLFSNPYMKYIFERLIMMIFVVFGVTFLVFTILYMSPMDPATNILGQHATADTVAEFNRVYGLDAPYFEQLMRTFRGIVTFDMGISFIGNEDVIASIMRLFPITLLIAFWSLVLSLVISIPAGIFSAIKPYSVFDYGFMFIALLGLSIPSFWQGLLFILYFSINWGLLPALFIEGNWLSLIMPLVVLGTSLAATVARMTRSSMLEVIKQDYVTTAKAKGLSYSTVVIKHVLGNAMIPIVTVVGIQFGGMLGGAVITERVFNIRGLGSLIVDRQFIPDIPVVMAGVIYVAIIVSITNLAVDILYAFLDPRIKSKMKSY